MVLVLDQKSSTLYNEGFGLLDHITVHFFAETKFRQESQ